MMSASFKSFVAIAAATSALALSGCGMFRDDTSASQYVDDSAITAKVKERFIENDRVSASAISVETMNGTVLLSGFSKSPAEKSKAEEIARSVKGVKSVKNAIVVK